MVRRVVVACWVLAMLTLALMDETPHPVQAQATGSADWQLTPLGGPVLRLFARADGVLYARTEDGLYRGDSGTRWVPLGLPPVGADPRTREVEVDPIGRAVLFASGAGGLYKSTDDGANWTLLLPTERHVQRIAASPADPALVYLALVGAPTISGDFWFLRSQDGGATWQQLEEHHNSLCGWSVPILLPHPTEPSRVFRAANCLAGRDFGDALWHSPDRGDTWSRVFGATSLDAGDPQLAYPARLVGGRGSAPARYYLAANRDARFGGSTLLRSDDEARTWTAVLAFRGGGVSDRPEAPTLTLGGLAYAPDRPDRVYVAVNVSTGNATARTPAGSGLKASANGGSTWADLDGPDLGVTNDLALDVDGRALYLATDRGIWRLQLDADPLRPPVQVPSQSG